MEVSDDDYIYRLSGVCIHRGTADHGHYWSYINTERGDKEPDPEKSQEDWAKLGKGVWKKFDDEMVSFFNVNDIKGECYGGDSTKLTDIEISTFIGGKGANYGKSAYMLVYECKKKNPMRIVSQVA
jgi:hypothetical protein